MALVRKEAYFNSSNGKNKIRTLIWQDDELTPIGIVQLTHGMAEHIARYDDFARFLASNGFVVCGHDHLGHGKSIESRAELGTMGAVNGDKRLVDDMHILTKIMKKRHPELPYFLFGHSMGSFCARVYAAHFGDELNGLIICGTGNTPSILSVASSGIDKLVEKYGHMKKIDAMGDIMNKGFSLLSDDKENPLAWLSANADNRLAYSNDDLCGFTYTLGGYRDIYNLMCEACEDRWPYRLPKDLPIMIISGANDPVGMNGKGVLAVADNLVKAGFEPTVILYPGMRHEILNETEKEIVYNDVLSFLHSVYTAEEN
ncbi:MAG: alpha/beta fold hydrolase [Candidatus Fimenecus sp.]